MVTVLDADGDGADDVLVQDGGGASFTLYTKFKWGMSGSPTSFETHDVTQPLATYITYPIFADPQIEQVRVLDINGDGMDDLVVVYTDYSSSSGNGNRPTLVFLISTGTGFTPVSFPTSCKIGGYVGDFDGDGRKDYLCSDYVNMYVRRSNGSGTLVDDEIKLPNVGYTIDSGTFVFDWNGDGVDDLLTFPNSADATVLVNTSGGPITQPGTVAWVSAGFEVTPPPATPQCSPTATSCTFPDQYSQQSAAGVGEHTERDVAVLDVNGDGLKDVYFIGPTDTIESYSNSPILFLNTGKGFRASSVSIPPGTKFSGFFPVIFDYDNDGREDLVDPVYGFTLRSTVRGTLEWMPIVENYQQQYGLHIQNPNPQRLSLADLNGDGRPDWLMENIGVRWGTPAFNSRLTLFSMDSVKK